jgi:hypothetical protein
MPSLLVFNRVYRLEIQGSHVGIFDRLYEALPLYPSPWLALPSPAPFPCVNKYNVHVIVIVRYVRGQGGKMGS